MSVYKDTKNNTWKVYTASRIGRAKRTSLQSVAFLRSERRLLGSVNSSTR